MAPGRRWLPLRGGCDKETGSQPKAPESLWGARWRLAGALRMASISSVFRPTVHRVKRIMRASVFTARAPAAAVSAVSAVSAGRLPALSA